MENETNQIKKLDAFETYRTGVPCYKKPSTKAKEALTFIGNYLAGLVAVVFFGGLIVPSNLTTGDFFNELAQTIGYFAIFLFPLWFANEESKTRPWWVSKPPKFPRPTEDKRE